MQSHLLLHSLNWTADTSGIQLIPLSHWLWKCAPIITRYQFGLMFLIENGPTVARKIQCLTLVSDQVLLLQYNDGYMMIIMLHFPTASAFSIFEGLLEVLIFHHSSKSTMYASHISFVSTLSMNRNRNN